MNLSAGRVLDLWEMLGEVIKAKRPMPVMGAYQLARLYSKLEREALPIKHVRDALIRELGEADPENPTTVRVVNGSLPVFFEKWSPVAAQMIEIEIQPIKLSALGSGEALLTNEIVLLGDLIEDA